MILHVCIPNTPFEHLDYLWTDEKTLPPIGTRVNVPFRRKAAVGMVIGHATSSDCPLDKLRQVTFCIDDDPVISEKQFLLYRWMSRYYHVPLSDVLTQALPVKFRTGELLNESDTGPVGADLVAARELPKVLNTEQHEALEAILNARDSYQCFLLQGITGSGKTEVYLQAVQAVLEAGKQVMVLVPEIGLTPQLLERFQQRFLALGYSIVLLHSGLNDTERWQAWCAARTGKAQIIIGTRSAVFVPVPHLGLIVVDEEHDASFKQQDSLRYSARDTAVVRAQMNQIPIILGTATPSLETLHNANSKKYTLLKLTTRAANSASPTVQLIDMRKQRAKHGVSPALLEHMRQHLEKKEQILVFINRRGYAPVLLCHACGFVVECPHCSSRLTMHSKKQFLQCHHCDYQMGIPKGCAKCQQESLVPVGVGTERLEEYLNQSFPDANIVRVDRDTMRRKNAFKEKLDQIHSGQVDILIGTQMLAKGHHFPNLTLVVMIDVDQGFFNHDFRAGEKIGQLILQVAGRAGRENKPGTVLIQTYVPDYPPLLMLLHEGYTTFSKILLEERQEAGFPPFAHMALLRCQSKQVEKARDLLALIKAELMRENNAVNAKHLDLLIFGPAPSPLEKKAGLYRMQLLLTAPTRLILAKAIHEIRYNPKIQAQRLPFTIDIDPQDLS